MIRRRPDTAAALKFWQMSFRRKSEPPPQKGKAARPGKGETALKNYRQPDFITARRARQRGRIEVDAVLAAHLLLAVVVGILWELTR